MTVKDILSRFVINRSDSSSVKLVLYVADTHRYVITHLYPYDVNHKDFHGRGEYLVRSFVVRDEELLIHIEEPLK